LHEVNAVRGEASREQLAEAKLHISDEKIHPIKAKAGSAPTMVAQDWRAAAR
jgi:hypothetical protein